MYERTQNPEGATSIELQLSTEQPADPSAIPKSLEIIEKTFQPKDGGSTLAVDVPIEAEEDEPPAPTGLGTLTGVFFPCLQNIFGVILFLRQPWITGQAGVLLTLLIVASCCCTTLMTALSMSAIATNGKVQSGGTYYMISRTLGPEFGGAVGLSFYLGTTIAASMYILGAEETLRLGLGLDLTQIVGGLQMQLVGGVITVMLTGVVYAGVVLVAMIGPWFLVAVIIGILFSWLGIVTNFASGKVAGVVDIWSSPELGNNLLPEFDEGFGINFMYGLFFPSVTGIMAGANRSAALANPSESIPKGTVAAILITGTVYLFNIAAFGAVATRAKLKNLKSIVCADVAWPHPVVVQIAVLLSTLGAGLQSLTGAPRLLQAILADEILPILSIFAEDPKLEPRKTLVVTFTIAFLCVMAGNLDIITPVVTMFFLMFYMFTNLALIVLRVLKPANFRPNFRYWSGFTCLLGFLLCVAIMLIISIPAASGAIVFAALVYLYIMQFGKQHDWGDGIRGMKLQSVRNTLLQLDGNGPFHHKNWSPNILVLTKFQCPEDLSGAAVLEEPGLLAFVRHLKKGAGLTVVGCIITDDFETGWQPMLEIREKVTDVVKDLKLGGFVEVVADTSMVQGISALIQVAGIGRFQPNMVAVGWPAKWREDVDKKETFITTLNLCERYSKGILVFRDKAYPVEQKQPKSGRRKRIDLWWKPHGGGLLILIPYLMSQHKAWAGCDITCHTILGENQDEDTIRRKVEQMFHELRFPCRVEIARFEQDFTSYTYPRTMMAQVQGFAQQGRERGERGRVWVGCQCPCPRTRLVVSRWQAEIRPRGDAKTRSDAF